MKYVDKDANMKKDNVLYRIKSFVMVKSKDDRVWLCKRENTPAAEAKWKHHRRVKFVPITEFSSDAFVLFLALRKKEQLEMIQAIIKG